MLSIQRLEDCDTQRPRNVRHGERAVDFARRVRSNAFCVVRGKVGESGVLRWEKSTVRVVSVRRGNGYFSSVVAPQ